MHRVLERQLRKLGIGEIGIALHLAKYAVIFRV